MKTRRILALMLSLTLILTTMPYAKASVGSGEEQPGGEYYFEEEHMINITCDDLYFTSITYYNEHGYVVGNFYSLGGDVKVSYGGSYSSTTSASGMVKGRAAVVIQCYGWGMTCRPITATQACK